MKILFNSVAPFFLGHGGLQIQIEQTKYALEKIGIEVEFLRWWDDNQKGDIIHYFGRATPGIAKLARSKGIACVMSDLLTAPGSRPRWQHRIHKLILRTAEKLLPSTFSVSLPSYPYHEMDACIALTSWEAHLMEFIYGAPKERIHIVPNGVEEIFFEQSSSPRGKWLVCTATITERKRVLELAKAAVQAELPVWIIGKPYSANDPYYKRFRNLAAKAPEWIRYEGAVDDRARLAQIYQEARGFVLLSTMESLSLSSLEAAASGCPLLVSDLPWARGAFGRSATYCPITSKKAVTARHLHAFYEAAPTLPKPPHPLGWEKVAQQLVAIYKTALTADPQQ